MRKMNKLSVSYSKGKEVSSKLVEEGKKVADSIADNLMIDNERNLAAAKKSTGIMNFFIWEDKGQITKRAKRKTKDSKE